LRQSQGDPVFFFRHVLGWDPWEKQEEMALAVRDHPAVVVKAANGVGKTACLARIALWWLAVHAPSIVFTTAPTSRQVRRLLWAEMKSAYLKSRVPLGGRFLDTCYWEIEPSWYAIGFTAEDPERFKGLHSEHILFIADEATGVPDEILDAAEFSLTSGHAHKIWVANPVTSQGRFGQAFKQGDWHRITISAFDSPNLKLGQVVRPYLITPEKVEERRRAWGEDSPLWQANVLGEFPVEEDAALIPMAAIQAAVQREITSGPSGYGVDVARFGHDATVFTLVQDGQVIFQHAFRGLDVADTASRAWEHIQEYRPAQVMIDDNGVGGGVVDLLQRNGAIVYPFITSQKPENPERFADLGSESYWGLRQMFIEGRISIPADDELIGALASLRYGQDRLGRIRVYRGKGPSPDKADSLMMAVSMSHPDAGEPPPRLVELNDRLSRPTHMGLSLVGGGRRRGKWW
jgi:hypothetical protein